jgi:hypothetical protein
MSNEYLYNNSIKYQKKFSKFIIKLSQDQKDALSQYKSIGFKKINEILRTSKYPEYPIDTLFSIITYHKDLGTEKPNYQKMQEIFIEIMNQPIKNVNILDSIFNKLKKYKSLSTGLNIPLYRGLIIPSPKYKLGSIVKFPEFISTSISKSIAFSFQNCGDTPCCIYIFHLNDNIPFIPLSWNMEFKYMTATDEHEFLLPRNTSWKLVKKYKITMKAEDNLHCNYDKIKKHPKIDVYEFEGIKYEYPQAIKELTNEMFIDLMYGETTHNSFFTVKNNLNLSFINNDEKSKISENQKDNENPKEQSSHDTFEATPKFDDKTKNKPMDKKVKKKPKKKT